ncbi:hypothetical protein M5D96_011646 [Drosophila gunungcola]|uniref:Uncharacterized protein n=1 Tax=Drosophila gunungcola TaxID=103775 RepID=A0A9Q0BK92_9MUSC|nr:hypothetical protein M5D96_011646 [Drosophila gunungcola]
MNKIFCHRRHCIAQSETVKKEIEDRSEGDKCMECIYPQKKKIYYTNNSS